MIHRHELSLRGADWQMQESWPHEWRWRKAWEAAEPPGLWFPATVPGTVQHDLQANGQLPDPYFELNSRACEWASQRDWLYRKEFSVPAEWAGRTVHLCCYGVDYRAFFYLNGQPLGEHVGTCVPVEFDVTAALRCGQANRLLVALEKAPDEQSQIGWTSRVRTTKPRFAYGWDFSTRLIPLGIWDEIKLVATGPAWLQEVWVTPLAIAGGWNLLVRCQVGTKTAQEVALSGSVALKGQEVAAGRCTQSVLPGSWEVALEMPLSDPQLWWPNGCGPQPLYRLQVTLRGPDGTVWDGLQTSFGVRTVEMVPNAGAPPDARPYTLVVNGKRLYLKGWNWTPVDLLYGGDHRAKYERLLRLVREAHVNLLRVWGGGLIETETFYQGCDAAGIMVWQEFPQSSSGLDNWPPDDLAYLDQLRRMAEAVIRRKRNHPSLVLWCGGNELMDANWKPLDETAPALGLLAETVRRLDPTRPYLPTSASGPLANVDPERVGEMHDVHGHWRYLGVREHYRFYDTVDPLLHSEFGCEGAASLDSLHRFASEEHLWPPDETNPIWVHHGSWWINRRELEAIFGEICDLPTFVRASQLMQAEGLRYILEANRRREGRCSGTLPWQFNEPWPNTSCTSAVDYFTRPKPAYYAVRRAYEPVHVSAQYDTLAWNGRDTFSARLWGHNSGASREAVLLYTVSDVAGEVWARESQPVSLPQGSMPLLSVSCALPPAPTIFLLRAELTSASGEVLSQNTYFFSTAPDPILAPLRAAPPAALQVQWRDGRLMLHNDGPAWALFVEAVPVPDAEVYLSDNHCCLAPGEQRSLVVDTAGARVQEWKVEGWNGTGHSGEGA